MTGYAIASRPLRGRSRRLTVTRARLRPIMAIAACAAALAIPKLLTFQHHPSLRVVDPCVSPDGRSMLRIDGLRLYRLADKLVITGVATNQARRTMRDTTVSALCLDSNYRAVDVRAALLERRLLPPGARSGFKLILNDEADVASVELAFEPLAGERAALSR